MSSILLGLSAVFSVINVIPRLARSGSYGFHKNLERRKGEKNGRWSKRFVGGGTKERRKKIFLIAARMIIIIIAERTRKKTTILSKESKRRSNSIRRIDDFTNISLIIRWSSRIRIRAKKLSKILRSAHYFSLCSNVRNVTRR